MEPSEDFSWMFPPRTMVEPAPWDQYWRDQVTHGVGGFVHMFCDDGDLVDAMRANGLKTVLCVGSGISHEPRALAWAGFEVTALDISPLAMQVAEKSIPPDGLLARLVGKRTAGPGGNVKFVAGDLCDLAICPGPYDVVIERKTLQLYDEEKHAAAMQRVGNRLASPGIFFSHCHDGTWKPPAPRTHENESWFVAQGWQFWQPGMPIRSRVAWLFMTTG